MLTPPLDWLDRALTPENVEDHPKPHPGKKLRMNAVWLSTPRTPNRELAEKAGRSEFGWPVFDFALKLAIAYPILFLILSWAVLGGAGKIGDFVLLPAADVWPARAIASVALVLAIGLLIVASLYQANGQRRFANTARLLALAVGIVGILAISRHFSYLAVEYAVDDGVAGFIAKDSDNETRFYLPTSIVVGELAMVVGIAFAAAFQLPGSFAAGIVCAFTFAFAATGSSVIDIVIATLLVGWGTFAVAALPAAMLRNGWAGGLAYALLVIVVMLVFSATAALETSSLVAPHSWIVFLGVLPLVNACFDYLSFGATRWLLRRGVALRNTWSVALGLADLAIAVVLFTLLGLALVAVLTLLNTVAAVPLVDLKATLIDIDANPGGYWWLYATFFSTLLPTLAHASLSMLCLVRLIPFRGLTAKLVENADNGFATAAGSVLLAQIFTAAILLPLAAAALIVLGILSVAPNAGAHYLYLFFSFAEWLDPTLDIPRGGAAI